MTMSLNHHKTLPVVAALQSAEEAAGRVRLVQRYNCLVGKPGKITRTIQKQFLMGYMSQNDVQSLRGLYTCVIAAMESAIRDSALLLAPMNKGDARWFERTILHVQDRR
jgi:hypothetical protein